MVYVVSKVWEPVLHQMERKIKNYNGIMQVTGMLTLVVGLNETGNDYLQ